MSGWSLYLLRCYDGKLYTGITTDVERRLSQHSEGMGAKFTRGRGPFRLVFSKEVGGRREASRLEWRVKRLRRGDKERLIEGKLKLDSLLMEVP
jgi:putative endonuclease